MTALALPGPVTSLFMQQSGVARVEQLLAIGMSRDDVARELTSGLWQSVGPTLVVAHNGPLGREQQEWAAVLGAGPRAALCGRTAAALGGLQRCDDGYIHVLVERGTTPPGLPLPIIVHESRRYSPDDDVHPARTPPMTRFERSVIDGATWTPQPRGACGMAVAAVQQRKTTASRLLGELARAGPVRHCRLLRTVLRDVAGGAHALSEVDFGQTCRRYGLPAPLRQSVRLAPNGRRRYVDVELRSRSGRTWLVEIDGAVHLVADTYWSDMRRANELVLGGEPVLRFPTVMLYLDERVVADQLRRALDD